MILGFAGSKIYCDREKLDPDSPLNPDDSFAPIRSLHEKLNLSGVKLVHHSEFSPEDAWAYLFFNYDEKMLKKIKKSKFKGKLFLVIFECKTISPANWDLDNHRYFDKVFTWRDDIDFVNSDRYVRFFWPNKLPRKIEPLPFIKRDKNFVMIACNKWKRRANELYTERFNAIKWFMDNKASDFDLYGHGWHYSPFSAFLETGRNFIRFIRNAPRRPVETSKVYKGSVFSKIEALRPYKFCICYENAEAIPGYITEKIFDCFKAGVVPVYLGWENVDKYIPRSTFIDKRSFPSYDELYDYLNGMAVNEYEDYLKAIEGFLMREDSDPFRYDDFVDTLISGMGINKSNENDIL